MSNLEAAEAKLVAAQANLDAIRDRRDRETAALKSLGIRIERHVTVADVAFTYCRESNSLLEMFLNDYVQSTITWHDRSDHDSTDVAPTFEVSLSIRDEYDHEFLTSSAITFTQPADVCDFLSHIAYASPSTLRALLTARAYAS